LTPLSAALPWGVFAAFGGSFGLGITNSLTGFTLTAGTPLLAAGGIGVILALARLVAGVRQPQLIVFALAIAVLLLGAWGFLESYGQTKTHLVSDAISGYSVAPIGPIVSGLGGLLLLLSWILATPAPSRQHSRWPGYDD
jgi:hypothetical protein